MIAIIDYNMGNLASVKNAFDKLNKKVDIISDPDKIKNYDKIVLPGVGAFGDAMEHLKEHSVDEAIKEFANSGKYMLGVCLGMQLLFNSSDEFGSSEGLGLIEGEVNYFKTDLKVPHMGWNEMFIKDDLLFNGLNKELFLYFVHSLHVNCDEKYVIGKTFYDYEFVSAVKKDNIYGFQPHPEKSHNNGLKILENFIML
jgi:glutamine amidotransferase